MLRNDFLDRSLAFLGGVSDASLGPRGAYEPKLQVTGVRASGFRTIRLQSLLFH